MTMTFNSFSQDYKKDIIPTNDGEIELTIIAHGSVLLSYQGEAIYIDPVGMFGTDYSVMPKADLILLTHAHGDHLDVNTISAIKKDNASILVTEEVKASLGSGEIIKNGESITINGIKIDAVPAYNIDKEFHPKGACNGYLFQFGDKKIYVAGDTDYIPEMDDLNDIEVAILPMNTPYTMTPDMLANAAKSIQPSILYPYHYSTAGAEELQEQMKELKDLLKDEDSIELRIWE